MFGMQSQSDGGSLFSGGGFMPSQATQVNEGGFSSVRKSGTGTGLLPLTVKQISEATQKLSHENSNFTIDGVDVNNVTLVGMVFNEEERVTDVSFYLDDDTGRSEMKRCEDIISRVEPCSCRPRKSKMGRSPCCSKQGLNRGAWTRKEDMILSEYIRIHGDGRWTDLPRRAGLKRCGKSCRLRWINYLRPDIKRGNISPDEEDLILRMHRLLGNRWSLIAGRLPGRTDNEIKNYWNTRLNKRLLLIKNCQPKSRVQNPETNSKSGDNHVVKTIPVRITAAVRYSEMVRSKRCNGYDRSNCRSDETFKLFNVTENASSIPHDDVGRVSFVMAEDNLPENHCNANGCTNYCSSNDAFKLCNVKENTNSITSVDSEHIALAMADVNLLETEDGNCSSSIWSLHEERAPQSYYFAGDATTLAEGLSELNVLSCPDCTLLSTVSDCSTDLELEEFFREPATLALPINNCVFTW